MLTLCFLYVSLLFMTIADPTTPSTASDPCDPARDRGGVSASAEAAATARQVRLLEKLAEAGMVFARAAGLRATAPAGPDETADFDERALIFGHVARAVRQTIGLEVKLRAGRRAGGYEPAADAAAERQLRLLAELAEIGYAVAKDPQNRLAVPIFMKIARAVRQTIGAVTTLREGRQTPGAGAGAAASPGAGAEPAAGPAEPQSVEEPPEASGNVAAVLTETLDAFNEYYRFLKVPVARAVAMIFKTLGVPVETGPDGDECRGDPASAASGAPRTSAGARPDSEHEQPAAGLDPLVSEHPGAGNRGPP
jgi:hypothetical protein